MKKQFAALSISTALLLNSIPAVAVNIDELPVEMQAKIEEMLRKSEYKITPKNIEELQASLDEVKKLKDKLQSVAKANSEDPIMQNLTIIQTVLVGISTSSALMHFTAKEKANISLFIAAATSVVNLLVRHHAKNSNLDPQKISEFLTASARELEQTNQIFTPELVATYDALNELSSAVLGNQNAIGTAIDKLGGASDLVAYATVVYFLVNWLEPRLAKETSGKLKIILPKIKAFAEKGTQVVKKPLTGSSAAGGIPDIASLALGMGSETSQKLITTTMNQLNVAAMSIGKELARQQRLAETVK